jgi:hypothetical protein
MADDTDTDFSTDDSSDDSTDYGSVNAPSSVVTRVSQGSLQAGEGLTQAAVRLFNDMSQWLNFAPDPTGPTFAQIDGSDPTAAVYTQMPVGTTFWYGASTPATPASPTDGPNLAVIGIIAALAVGMLFFTGK